MLSALLTLLALLAEPLLWVWFGPRHDPPRTEMGVLGDIDPNRP
jgi:hypothetical protein